MKNQSKTKQELLEENAFLKKKIQGLEHSESERKRVEKALLKSEVNFRAMVDTIPLAIYLSVGIEQKSEYINPMFIKLFGYTLDDVPTVEQWWPLTYPDENYRRQISEEWTTRVKRAIETKSTIEPMEVVVTCKDGSKKNIMWGYITLGEKNYAYGLDLTERKRTEEALLSENEFNRLVIENASQGICVCREIQEFPYVRFTVWNECMTLITGYSMDEVNRLGWYQSMYPDPAVQERAIMRMQSMRAGDNIQGEEWEITRADGQKRQLLITTRFYTGSKGEPLVLGVMNDISDRKLVEDELRASERKYRTLTEQLPDLIWHKDLNNAYMFCNRHYAEAVGLTTETIVGHRDEDFYSPELVAKYLADDQSVITTGQLLETEELSQKAGNERWLYTSKVALLDESGQCIGTLGIARDITERKCAEKALRESEDRFRTLIDKSPLGMSLIDIDGRYEYVNPAFVKIFGYDLSDIPTGNEWFRTAYPDPEYRRKVMADWKEDLSSYPKLEIRPRTHEVRCKEGALKTILFRPITLPSGKQFITYEDITERKRAEDTLLLNAQRMQALLQLNQMKEATLQEITDFVLEEAVRLTQSKIGYLAFLNEDESILTMHSWSKSAIAECAITEKPILYPIESTGLWGEAVRQRRPVITNDYTAASPLKKGYPEGHVVVKRHMNIPVFEDSRIVIVAGVGNKAEEYDQGDVQQLTVLMEGMWLQLERKRAEAEKVKLEEQHRQAQKMEAVGQLAGGVAHDFNNMLNIILGYSQIALMKIEPSSPLNANLQEIMSAAQRSSDLVRQLLAFARKQTIAPKVLDINDTVTGMLNMLRKLIGEDIDLLWMPVANLWPVKMDPVQVDQILANLAVNARDSISGVGKITIETGKEEFDDSYCAQHAGFVSGHYAMLAVSDNGCGMDKETCEKIFEPFFTTKEIGKGTGMGLATVYGIVKQNNGFINVYSEPGKGTTFKIYLPRHEEGETKTDEPRQQAGHLTGTETVLLVEDNEALLKMAKIMLEELGYTVLAAGSPDEAIKLAEQYMGDIHLVLTDVVMPEMSGRDLQKRFSALWPGLKFLFMSGYTTNVIAHRGILDEGIHFLQKPFRMEVLATKLREALDKVVKD
jgi:PAS domain S-box-containing protein